MLAIGAAASSLAAPVGHAAGAGGFHGGGYRGGYYGGGHAYSGWHGRYYGGWRGYGGYYGPWRGGWAGGWGWGGWGWGWTYPWVGLGWYAPVVQYEVVQYPISGTTPSSPAPTQGRWTDLFAYPKGGQSKEQQIRDREECHRWAVEQSGFDPAQPTHDNSSEWAAKRDSYLRAETACLQARSYSVK
jgi:hypothetical protein